MKHTRFAVYAAAAILLLVAVLTVTGCGGGGGGSLNSTINTRYDGRVAGVATEPADGETNIATSRVDSWIHIYWPDAHQPPPARFTVSVQKEEHVDDWGAIHTKMSVSQSDPIGGSWWFQADSDFSPHTLYRIIVQADGEAPYVAQFETGASLSMASTLSTRSIDAPKGHRPARPGDADGEDSLVHTITR